MPDVQVTPLPIYDNGSTKYALLIIPDPGAEPPTIDGFACIYIDPADGDLKIKFADGTVKTITVDT